jgi:hypothetical protein
MRAMPREDRGIELVRAVLGGRAGGLRTGTPRSAGALTLVPLFGALRSGDYVLGAQAMATGMLRVEELDGGTVPRLLARNLAGLPALLLGGEHLEGARQNRILTTTVLLPPHRDTVIPVACVEQGHWGYEGRQEFAPAPHFAFAGLRARSTQSVSASMRGGQGPVADQGTVWQAVAERHAQVVGAPARTGAMREAFDRHRPTVESMVLAIGRPEAIQTGVAGCVGGRVVALDAFDRPEVLNAVWDRLVAGYALDAVGEPARSVGAGSVRRFLDAASRALVTSHAGVGLGTDVVVAGGGVVGNGLVWEEGVVHLALFPGGPDDSGGFGPGRDVGERPFEQPIVRPAQRARLRRHFHSGG